MVKRKQPASGGGPSQGELFYELLLLFCELLQKFYKISTGTGIFKQMENAYRENVLRSKDDADKASLKAEADVLEGALLYASSREDAKSANSLLAEASVRARLEKKDMDHHNGMVAYHMRELEASRARYAAAKAKMEATEQQIPQLAAVASSKNAAVLVEQAKCQSLLETSSALKAAKEEQENRVLSLAYIGADKSVLAVDSGARVPVDKMGNAVCMICLVRVAFESHFKSLVHCWVL